MFRWVFAGDVAPHEADEVAVYFIYIICRAAEATRRDAEAFLERRRC
jgi:hypothetical protein